MLAAQGVTMGALPASSSSRRDRDARQSWTPSCTRLRSYDGLLLHASHLVDDAALLRGDHPVVVLGERAYRAPVDHVLRANEAGWPWLPAT